jgi:hypothetical protein
MTARLLIKPKKIRYCFMAVTLFCLVTPLLIGNGCYNHQRGNPVDTFHYEHSVTIVSDYSNLTIHTYLNRDHLTVGYRRESLYDGDRDGQLVSEGIDRVQITDYLDVEASQDDAERITGEIRNYDELFRNILNAAKSGDTSFMIDDRPHKIRFIS